MSLPNDPNPSSGYDTGQFGNVVAAVRDLRHPKEIGPYSIQDVIGEGGMGTVYRALQREPIHRTVAIKIIKLGMDTREVIARFESERQALALMNHTNVAKVLDAGATEAGRPYFVMEYFKGEPITTYSDRHKLTVADRLLLFTQACDAVQHAHHKAIIHRDLKPSNILVTEDEGRPVVKVIDFGVAKALSQPLTEKTLFTSTGQLVGTPEYMAPEQAESNAPDVDTRTDVYSLGVILYELLSGALPFDAQTLRSGGYNEIQRIIREVDPPRPSTRLTRLGADAEEVARRRNVELGALTRQLKSELEWIPLKAMRKERGQRYASPSEFSEDVQNYLSNRPLRAGPETAGYRAKKFLRRNKAGVVAAATIFLLLLSGITATTWQAIRATRAEHAAVKASENLTEVNRFLTEDLLASAAPEVSLGKEMTVREAVDRAAENVATRFKDRPEIEANVRLVLAETYNALGHNEQALPHAKTSMELSRRLKGDDAEETLAGAQEYARQLILLNRASEAEVILRDIVERATRTQGAGSRAALAFMSTLGLAVRQQDRLDEAGAIHEQVFAGHKQMFGIESEQTAKSLANIAVIKALQNKLPEAEQLLIQSVEIRKRVLPPDHPATLGGMTNLARIYEDQGRFPEAEKMHRQVLEAKRRVLKDDHPETISSMLSLATSLVDLKRYDEAESLTREAYERGRRTNGPDELQTLLAANNLAFILNRQNKPAEAEPIFRDVVERRRRVLGPTHAHTVSSVFNLMRTLIEQQKDPETDALLDALQAKDAFDKLFPDQQSLVLYQRGVRMIQQGKPADAEPLLLGALEYLRKSDQKDPQAVARIHDRLADVYESIGRQSDAASARAKAKAVRATTEPSTNPAK